MTIQELHYDFKIKVDKIDSLQEANFKPWEIDWILNLAIDTFVDNVYSDFEKNQSSIDDLIILVVKSPAIQPAITPSQISTGIYEAPLDNLIYPYEHLIRCTADVIKDNCPSKNIVAKPIQHDDLSLLLRDAHNEPSYEWQSLPYTNGKGTNLSNQVGSIYLYTNGNFTITKVYPEYIKRPAYVHIGTYTNLQGSATLTECDLPEQSHRKIVDMAVLITKSGILESPEYLKLQNLNN
jgi:hypothetical protein